VRNAELQAPARRPSQGTECAGSFSNGCAPARKAPDLGFLGDPGVNVLTLNLVWMARTSDEFHLPRKGKSILVPVDLEKAEHSCDALQFGRRHGQTSCPFN